MTFQAIDTDLIINQANQSASKAGIQLTWVKGYRGMLQAYFGDKFSTPQGAVSPMLFLRNINDGGHALMIGVGLFRFVCMNGLVVGDNFYSQRVIHRSGPTLDEFLGNLEKNLDAAFETAASLDIDGMVQELVSREVTEKQGIEVLASLPLPQNVIDSAIFRWVMPTRQEDAPRNLWSLYNVVNESNRVRSNSVQAFNREISMLENIEALLEFNSQAAA
jgi:hypothetical protein